MRRAPMSDMRHFQVLLVSTALGHTGFAITGSH
jgi:hypothetical protein